jgi:hypothetical protein
MKPVLPSLVGLTALGLLTLLLVASGGTYLVAPTQSDPPSHPPTYVLTAIPDDTSVYVRLRDILYDERSETPYVDPKAMIALQSKPPYIVEIRNHQGLIQINLETLATPEVLEILSQDQTQTGTPHSIIHVPKE